MNIIRLLEIANKIKKELEWREDSLEGLGGSSVVSCIHCGKEEVYWSGMKFEHRERCPIVMIDQLIEEIAKQ